jgi:EAL domain-containing protein (putative c-di-GMP-specific phosphodiesterase class I)
VPTATDTSPAGCGKRPRQALSDTTLTPSKLTLEITESVLMKNPSAAIHRLEQLKQLGVRIAIDDFGTGYSSLAYLRQLPVAAIERLLSKPVLSNAA